ILFGVPFSQHYAPPATHRPLLVRLEIQPTGHELTLDPMKVVYMGSNQSPIEPYRVEAWRRSIWSDDKRLFEGEPKQFNFAKHSIFYLRYDVESSPDIRFSILVDGLSDTEGPLPSTTVHFEPARIKVPENDTIVPPVFIIQAPVKDRFSSASDFSKTSL